MEISSIFLVAYEIYFPDQGWNLGPQQLEVQSFSYLSPREVPSFMLLMSPMPQVIFSILEIRDRKESLYPQKVHIPVERLDQSLCDDAECHSHMQSSDR